MMNKIIFTYGIIAGVIVSAMLLMMFSGASIDMDGGKILGYATMIIAFSTIFIATKTYRDKQLEGTIAFGRAFQIGLGIAFVASVLYVVTWMIMLNTVAKDFMAEYYQQSLEHLKESNLSETELSEKIAKLENLNELYKNPFVKIGMTFLEIFPVGFIVSLISALILKKKPTT